jgi:hypothetical protein
MSTGSGTQPICEENTTDLLLFRKKQVGASQIAPEERLSKVVREEDLLLILSRTTARFSKDHDSKSHLPKIHRKDHL